MTKHLTIYTDGGSRGNPGQAAYGFVIYNESNEKLYEEGQRLGITTNNVAEYMGVIKALEWIEKNTRVHAIDVYLDSQLVASQLSGIFKVKTEHIRDLFLTVKKLEQKLSAHIVYTAVPREKNTEADRMVNLALDQKKG